MGIRYDERAGAWAVHNEAGSQVGEASTKRLATLYAAAPDMVWVIREAVALVENHAPQFGGIAAKWRDVLEEAGVHV